MSIIVCVFIYNYSMFYEERKDAVMKNEIIKDFIDWLKKENLELINNNATSIVAVYIRVSTDRQEELSPISQLKEVY